MPKNSELGGYFQPASIQVGDVMQIAPECKTNLAFSGCMLTVTEVKTWGVTGYVQALGENRTVSGGQAYIRIKWEELAYVGHAVWTVSTYA